MFARRLVSACLMAMAVSAQAAPMTFIESQFNVTSLAMGDAAAGFETLSSPPVLAPISASADSVGDLGIAVAGAIAGPGLLTTSADVSSTAGIANAVATANFFGSYLNEGRMKLNIDFTIANSSFASGDAVTSLFVMLVSDGITLFEDFVFGSWEFDYVAASGSIAELDLTLTSEAVTGLSAAGLGAAGAFGLVTFGGGTVPTPGTVVLLLAGLAGLVVINRRQRHTATA